LTVVRWLLSTLICLGSLVLVGAPAARAEVVPWLYEVEVPVADQSAAARTAAAQAALLELLTRLTGLTNVPRMQAVTAALAAPDQYYNQFRFVDAQREDELGQPQKELHVSIQFEAASILRLLKSTDLPIWRADRPKVVAWVVVEANGQREIIGADSHSDLALAMQQRAKQRGLWLTLPLLDLEDQVHVDPAAVWGRLSAVLDPASERYDADIVLVGRVQALDDGSWAAGWEFWIDGAERPLAAKGEDSAMLGRGGVDFVADELAQRYAVLARAPQNIRLNVAGIRSPADYGNLLGYLGRLEFVDEVRLASVRGDRMALVLTTRAEPEQLLKMFAVDQYLAEAGGSGVSPSGIELLWQRR